MRELQRLKDAGLLVTGISTAKPVADRYGIAKPLSPDATSRPHPAYFRTPQGDVIVEDASSLLYRRDDQWVFEVWERAPGPGEDDFICTFPMLDQAIDAILAFYFGAPTLIDDWQFPLHRHPELSLEVVNWALKNTIHVTQDMFDGIAERRWNKVKDRWPIKHWERALQSQFLTIHHVTDPTQTLRLRRDGQETYIVHRSTG